MPSADPLHVFYAGAHLIQPGLSAKLTGLALRALDAQPASATERGQRVRARLERGAVADLRIDFEDGFGARSAGETSAFARQAAQAAAGDQALPPHWGVRVRSAGEAMAVLEHFAAADAIPAVVALPKVQSPDDAAALAHVLDRLGWLSGIELMVETVRAVQGLPALIDACAGRCRALHFGVYDFLSELGVPGPEQSLMHPYGDQARYAMHAAAAGTALRLVDGVTQLLPLGEQAAAGWDLHARHVRFSLSRGFHASWDLHPAQVAARYWALFTYFDEHKEEQGQRLRNFAERQARATRAGAAFDDAATVRGLARFFAQAVECGATSEDEAAALTGWPAGARAALL